MGTLQARDQPSAVAHVIAEPSEKRQGRRPACVECRRRKIKCDRQYPCVSCIALDHECRQPPPGPARRPRRRNHHELYDKIARVESLLAQCAIPLEHKESRSQLSDLPSYMLHSGEPDSFQQPAALAQPQRQQPKGTLVHVWNGGLEFRDSKAMAVVFDDLQTIRALIDVELEQEAWLPLVEAPGQRQQSCDTSIPFTDQLSACVPPAHAIDVLWRVFLDRVNPVTKVIHVPTFRMRVIEAINDFTSVPLATAALLFSVFLTASGSLSRQEHWDELGRSQADTIADFTLGLKLALTELNYLKNHNPEVLCSLALYSLFQQTRNGSSDPWILNGVVVNIAYRLGLHLDGSHANLSAFQCEMRRRLWWQIVILETRSGGAFGTGSHLLPSHRDTRIPLNVNDEDLSPTMPTEPCPHDGPTEMSFCIVTYELRKQALAQPRLWSIDDILWRQLPSPANPYSSPSAEMLGVMTALQWFSKDIDGVLHPLENNLCPDPASNPLHAMAQCNREALSRIIQLLVTPMEESPEWGTEVLGPDDNFFRISLAANEEALRARKAAGRRFAWYADIDFKMQGFYYLGAQLQSRPAGSMAHRVWSVMEDTYALHEELWELRDKENMTLCNLLLSAWDRRSVHLATSHEVLPEPPFLSRLREQVMVMKAEALGIL
ncbi:fungal specific transcription factor domain-containing protein [Colletotrichum graminicola]|uniref:Fungal specific transcription factor domain-containing protein n=1 Tax=Colletotrichum graminicola (strain M1.001 / M2 / FGSC 10212) TaxID=645133 RepID=E3Q2M7_COLGM|nr:fungal specific transcription factor domain-containing protein [Colletotrichum graminicola M1.001]EFQ25328.1 fungal specific transcription factor domain-containing protein [Colletotrichum graminicola M1.001]WDK15000.1 fungal specific transcription factor domain-containing protein [Colletotrichum graminicola]